MLFREAKKDELNVLNAIIKASKAHWGYSSEFIQDFMDKFGMTQEYLDKEHISVLTQTQPIAVIAFSHQEIEPMLDYFFLTPALIGQGLGRKMWQQVLAIAKKNKWASFQFYSDPNAENFYHHMGAKTIGKHESFPGRFVPILRYTYIPRPYK